MSHAVVRCIFPAAWRMLSGCCGLHAACRLLQFPKCMLHVVCCLLHIFPVVACGIAVRWILSACAFSVAFHTFSVACFRVPAPVSRAAWRALSVACPTSHLVCCMCCVVSRRLYVACCTSRAACCLLCVACPILHVVTPSRLLPARTHACTHAHVGLQQVSPATEALNCERRRGYSRARG